MNRNDYLLFAIKHRCYVLKRWIIAAFTVSVESDEQKAKQYIGKILREPFGVFYLDENLEKQPLDVGDIKPTEPLYSKRDSVTLLKRDIPWLAEEKVDTTVGLLLLNLLVVYEPFKGKLPYINKRGITPRAVEKLFSSKLQDTPPEGKAREPGVFYVDELIAYQKAVGMLEGLSKVFSCSITRQGILPPPGAEAFRKEALKRYEGKLHDPTEMVKFQTELKEFDRNYLKENDPSFGKFMAGKVVNARSKSYMTQGGETNSFIDAVEMTPITQPLVNGIDLTPEKFAAVANTIRYGSFARGAETVNGGVVAKALMTALDTWKILDKDCGAQLGVVRRYRPDEIKKLVGRYLIQPNKTTLLIENEEQAKAFADKVVNLRSPQYCREPGLHTCKVCAGIDLSRFGSGLVIPAMEVSSGIMSDSLKKMHDTTASAKPMILTNAIT